MFVIIFFGKRIPSRLSERVRFRYHTSHDEGLAGSDNISSLQWQANEASATREVYVFFQDVRSETKIPQVVDLGPRVLPGGHIYLCQYCGTRS